MVGLDTASDAPDPRYCQPRQCDNGTWILPENESLLSTTEGGSSIKLEINLNTHTWQQLLSLLTYDEKALINKRIPSISSNICIILRMQSFRSKIDLN